MKNEQVAAELLKVARELTNHREAAAMNKLIRNVLKQAGEKAALAMHNELLKKAGKYTDDERLNPGAEAWIPDMMPIMIDAAITMLKKYR